MKPFCSRSIFYEFIFFVVAQLNGAADRKVSPEFNLSLAPQE